ncbi:TIGR02679 family protein [Actinoallomurus iriomotensis]|uniref:TIGR02679 family protein n=1 Tax=Actinoallomurus iriomotensis TaxID=478107 RepID=A0A9W6SB64_9ACTN|nr:TIGR02679 family protein [Actinoallomurus iriomotensis]GLY90403.1 hypothetical protein Airi02_083320 [Actinoallomurus iriomotensis]
MTLEQRAIERFHGPAYRRLLDRARDRLERRGGSLSGTISLADPTHDERRALDGLLGGARRPGAGSTSVELTRLDAAVRTSCGLSLAELLETVFGRPLSDRPAEKAAKEAARAELLRLAEESPLYASADWFRDWAGARGRLARLVTRDDAHLFADAVAVLERLESSTGTVELTTLADEVTGDTKALGPRSPLSRLVLDALARRVRVPRPETAEECRRLWEVFGVSPDDLASRVLVLNLPAEGAGLGEWLTGAARYGTPFPVTLNQLRKHPVTAARPVVYVCENPTIVRRAAAELGAAAPPLLCTEGLPSLAFHRLASTVTTGGGTLRYHGDFDWPGLAIAHAVMRRHGAEPWRMSAADYLAGVRGADRHLPLKGRESPSPWAPDLATTMAGTGLVVSEETVADRLIADLRSASRTP